jgi:hypothetical protein
MLMSSNAESIFNGRFCAWCAEGERSSDGYRGSPLRIRAESVSKVPHTPLPLAGYHHHTTNTIKHINHWYDGLPLLR